MYFVIHFVIRGSKSVRKFSQDLTLPDSLFESGVVTGQWITLHPPMHHSGWLDGVGRWLGGGGARSFCPTLKVIRRFSLAVPLETPRLDLQT